MRQKVLIARCDKECRGQLGKILSAELFELYFLSDNEDMLLELLERDYNLLVYGLRHDDCNALKIIKIIKNVRPKLPIIVISGNIPNDLAAKILQEGVVYFAVKPYNPKALKSIIYKTLID